MLPKIFRSPRKGLTYNSELTASLPDLRRVTKLSNESLPVSSFPLRIPSPQPQIHHQSEQYPEEQQQQQQQQRYPKLNEKLREKIRKLLKKRPSMETLQKKGILHYSVFGSPLASVVEKERKEVPDFALKCIKEVETRGLDVEGIYRISDTTSQVQKLRYTVDQEQRYSLEDLDINIITGALKLFLREMPEPLVPFAHYDTFMEAAYISDNRERVANLRNMLSNFPKPNYDLFHLLCNHLEVVTQQSDVNKMKSSNLAIVFGPTLVCPKLVTAEYSVQIGPINNTLEFVISNYRELFKR